MVDPYIPGGEPMKRIRNVDYYYRDLAPPGLDYFLADEVEKIRDFRLIGGEVLKVLMANCITALGQNLRGIPTHMLRQVLEEPLQESGISAECSADFLRSMETALSRVNAYVASGQYWSLANSLIPFTDTSIPTKVKVRQCRLCHCWVRDGDKDCPSCLMPAPKGKARRAWERQQIRVQQPPALQAGPVAGLERPKDLRWDNLEALSDGEIDDEFPGGAGEIDIGSSIEDGHEADEVEESQ
jgi:hypothetical protein